MRAPLHLVAPEIPALFPDLHNLEAEQALLGAILNNNAAFYAACEHLEPEHFFEPIHQQIYTASREMIRGGRLVTPITLKTHLPNLDIGGITVPQYLARLAAEATTIINAPDFARVVRDLAVRRDMLTIVEDHAATIRLSPVEMSSETIATSLIDRISEVSTVTTAVQVSAVTLGEAADQAVSQMAEIQARGGGIGGITTGLSTLDGRIDGWHRGELAIAAGRPGMGKTGFVFSSALKTAAAGYNCNYHSLEMGAPQLAVRAISDLIYNSHDQVPYATIQRGRASERESIAVAEAARALRGLPLIIEQQPSLTLPQIVARARKHKARLARSGKTLDVVFVDHIHIVKPNDRYRGNRVAEITEISGGLKALAKDLDVAVVALAQLSRQVENREDRRPQMSDLRDSGSIEQDADLIIFLYREQYYLERMVCTNPAEEDKRVARLIEVRNTLELNIAKQRNGPTSVLKILFNAGANAARDLAVEEAR